MLKQLIHNGVLVPEPPSPRNLTLRVRGELVRLTPVQEEMAMAWAKKHGTPYVEDPVFIQNFMDDFSQVLGIEPPLAVEKVDFMPAVNVVLREKAAKEALTKEERKVLAAERKVQREALKEQYGYATVDGERVEIGGYVVEPSGIFMGRGEHPLRGRWKQGASERDITLNLSPDAPRPPGDWGEFVWQPDSLWVARWEDKLSGKLKYIWLSDTAPVKQEREAEKFDQAVELDAVLEQVRAKIQETLTDSKPRRRMVATACYLIDVLCLRVGDEKDEDEADTVGATTLRPEHVTLHPNGTAEFNFLGKDSVEWHKTIALPAVVHKNLAQLIENARPSVANGGNEDKPQIFPLISSRSVNRFLSSVLPGLTAKVFRTHHATEAVQQSLEQAQVTAEDPEYKKWEVVTRANLVAAELCNHTKQAPANWSARLERMKEREGKYEARVEQREAQLQERVAERAALYQQRDEALTTSPVEEQRAQVVTTYEGKVARAQRRIEIARERLDKARLAVDKEKKRTEQRQEQHQERSKKLASLRQEQDEKLAACTADKQRQRVTASYEKKIARAQNQLDTAQEQLEKAQAALSQKQQRVEEYLSQLEESDAKLQALHQERDEKLAFWTVEKWRERVLASYETKIARAERRVEVAQERLEKAEMAVGKLRAQMAVNNEKRTWNLGTSLKSYIDPRVYYRWGQQVDYDVLERYYPKTLRRKFAWVRNDDASKDQHESD